MVEFDKTEYRGYTITTYYDDTPENPLSWDTNIGTVYTKGGNYGGEDVEDILDDDGLLTNEVAEKNYCLPVYMYKHSGVAVSTAPFADAWDSGQIGWIIFSKEKAAKEFPGDVEEKALNAMRQTIDLWGAYLEGDVYGYITTDEDGDEIDSCWGFYGSEGRKYMLKDAQENIECEIRHQETETKHLIGKIEAALKGGVDASAAAAYILHKDKAWRALLYGAKNDAIFVFNRIEDGVLYPGTTTEQPYMVPLKVLRKINSVLNHKK